MPDILSKRKRSALMALIRGRGNKATELRLIAIFRAQGITGWRRGSTLPGHGKSQIEFMTEALTFHP